MYSSCDSRGIGNCLKLGWLYVSVIGHICINDNKNWELHTIVIRNTHAVIVMNNLLIVAYSFTTVTINNIIYQIRKLTLVSCLCTKYIYSYYTAVPIVLYAEACKLCEASNT